MPNTVRSRCQLMGPAEAIARFRAECIRQHTVDDAAVGLDFEAVLPSPEILHGTTGSSAVSNGLAVLGVALPGVIRTRLRLWKAFWRTPGCARQGLPPPRR